MVAAAGSGELLFTPRAGSLYGYRLIWALLAAVVLKWVITREIGRFAVCTGTSILGGVRHIGGRSAWALWVLVVPQLLVAVITLSGLAGAAATAWVLFMPGSIGVWAVLTLALAMALVAWGRYAPIELAAKLVAVLLGITAIAAASSVLPAPITIGAGLVPQVPPEVDWSDVLPWLGFAMAGAAGLMWYSYWIPSKEYGAGVGGMREEPVMPDGREHERLRGWLRQMTLDVTVAVAGALLLILAFLVLGTELLGPKRLVPEENQVAETLGRMLGDLWGPWGYWFMIAGLLVGFFGTVLSNQDGWGRLLADGARALLPRSIARGRLSEHARLHRLIVVTVLSIAPAVLILLAGEPVRLLKLAGAIEAAHIPFVTVLTVLVNQRLLPEPLRPSHFTVAVMLVAALFFASFACVYFLQLL